MTDLQEHPEYMQVLVSIPDLLAEYFAANNIHDESQAKYSTEREDIAGFYPMLKAYATELELFYNIKTEPIDISDRAAAAYWLSSELSGRIADNPQLQNIGSIADEADYNLSTPIREAFEWGEGLPSEEERNRFFSWNMFLSRISDAYLDTIASQIKKDIYYQIDSRDIGRVVALCYSNKQNLEDNIEKVNGILYDSCIYYAENGLEPSRSELTKHIFSRFEGYEDVLSKEQMHQVVYKAAAPLLEIILSDNGELAEMMSSRHELAILQQQYDPLILSPEALRMHAFQQKVQKNWETPLPSNKQDLILKPRKLILPLPDVGGELQKLELQHHNQLQAQHPHWTQYETLHPIAPDSELAQGLKGLLANAISANSYYEPGQQSLIYFEYNQLFKVLSITDDQPVDSLVARNLLDFSKELMIYAENSEKYLGIKLADQKLDRKVLAELSYADVLYPDNFKVLTPFWSSFANHQKELNQLIANVEFVDPSNQIYQQIVELPESLEKFNAVELYYHTNLAIQRLMLSKEHQSYEESLRGISKIHHQQFEQFSDNLELLGSAYPEVKKYDVSKLAHELERSVCNSYLLPAYCGKDEDFEDNFFDEIKDFDAFGKFSNQAMEGIFKATDDFTEAAIIQHQLVSESETAEKVSISVQQYQTYYDYAEQLIDNISNATNLLQIESAGYFRYNLHKENMSAQNVEKTYNYEILAKRTPGRN